MYRVYGTNCNPSFAFELSDWGEIRNTKSACNAAEHCQSGVQKAHSSSGCQINYLYAYSRVYRDILEVKNASVYVTDTAPAAISQIQLRHNNRAVISQNHRCNWTPCIVGSQFRP